MKYKILPIKNISRMRAAGDALLNRSPGMPGMGLMWAPTGYGKTTAATWFVNQVNGVYIRALRLWSPKSMLNAILRELDMESGGNTNGEMVERIIEKLAETGRPLFIDEADYCIDSKRLVDTLRDIHDLSTVPVILIGMQGIKTKLNRTDLSQFTGRISQWVEFSGADIEDARMLANGLCEVAVADDLLIQLHQAASPQGKQEETLGGAEIRRLVVGLGEIEQHALRRGWTSINAAQWDTSADFFVGQAAPTAQPKIAAIGH